jgi:hypothetical protein
MRQKYFCFWWRGESDFADNIRRLPHQSLMPPIGEGGGLPGLLCTFLFSGWRRTGLRQYLKSLTHTWVGELTNPHRLSYLLPLLRISCYNTNYISSHVPTFNSLSTTNTPDHGPISPLLRISCFLNLAAVLNLTTVQTKQFSFFWLVIERSKFDLYQRFNQLNSGSISGKRRLNSLPKW